MVSLHGHARLLSVLIPGLLVIGAASSCSRLGQTSDQAQVVRAFESWKKAVINHQTDQAMAYIPRHVDDYLNVLNSSAGSSASAANTATSASPGVDLLLRTALEKKVPADMRSNLTLNALMQRISDRHLFNPRDVHEIVLGRVTVNGDHASAEVYYQQMKTALQLPFIKEDGAWKIDVMALLPYAEVLMRLDRALKGETEAQQVDQLVDKLPSL
ncbi:MAG: hypothetical protein LV480_09795 [Methylacidiphilales bacterium]|nr:hypothetical protein [Candidatus Methylacidiphilales bacterium]